MKDFYCFLKVILDKRCFNLHPTRFILRFANSDYIGKQNSCSISCEFGVQVLEDMEEGLLFKEKDQEEEGGKKSLTWDAFVEEAKKVGYIAGPMVAANLSLQLISVISLMMVGHLGEIALAGTSMATSFCAVTGSNPVISHEAGRYATCMIPALFSWAIFQPLMKYLQTQSLIVPMLLSSMTTLCLHIPLCWVFVFHLGFGNIGAAFASCISYWLNVVFLGLYVKYSPSCKSTRVSLSKEAFQGIGEFLSLAVPSAVMWWSFEIMILLSGLLPNPQLETSVLSIWYDHSPHKYLTALHDTIWNCCFCKRPQAARLAVFTAMIIAGTEIAIVSSTLFVCRYIVGYAYSNAEEVVDYVTAMVPLICLSTILDGLQGVLSGVARGTGWQRIGAYVNLGSLYIGGIPVSLLLGFFLNWRGRGLWLGIMSGSAIQTVILCVITIQTNWEKQAAIARERIFQ
ncbi:hypothetical protein C5167_021655 [Papaver somniferum]|nr:hypothetical protein C5167_021655 [Papaver somniferum]